MEFLKFRLEKEMVSEQGYARVKVSGEAFPVRIPVTSRSKPEVSRHIQDKWQGIIDSIAGCFNIPAALIMSVGEERISVFISSRTEGNPYSPGDSEKLNMGLYCETVMGSGEMLIVPDAEKDPAWDRNPDIKLGMISYMGLPVLWPDGEVFGTICVLDSCENFYSESYISLITVIRDSIEKDLEDLILKSRELEESHEKLETTIAALNSVNRQLEKSLREKDLLLSEVHHRVKNNLQIIISLIDLQAMNETGDMIHSRFRSIKTRIQSMGILHNILYKSGNFERVSVKEYTEMLMNNLEITFHDKRNNYRWEVNIDDRLIVNIDTAVTVGLIINEIVTNSIKHAFNDISNGVITVQILQLNEGTFCMKIRDNGCGIPDEVIASPRGLGHELIEVLVEQLNGFVELSRNKGTAYTIVFDRVDKEDDRWLKKYS